MLARAFIFASLAVATVLACRLSPAVRTGTSCGVVMELPDALPGYVGRVGTPDAIENAIARGRATRPTVIPATRSPPNFFRL